MARKGLIDGFWDDFKAQALILLDQYRQGYHQTPEDFQAALKLAFKGIVDTVKKTKNPDKPFSRVGWHINNDHDNSLLKGIQEGVSRRMVRAALRCFLKLPVILFNWQLKNMD